MFCMVEGAKLKLTNVAAAQPHHLKPVLPGGARNPENLAAYFPTITKQ
jgi:hypothetical protein